jgi:hypothetical protein
MSIEQGNFVPIPAYNLPEVDEATANALWQEAIYNDPGDVVVRLAEEYDQRNRGLVTLVQDFMPDAMELPSGEELITLAVLTTHDLLVAAAGSDGVVPHVQPSTHDAMKADIRDKGPTKFGADIDAQLAQRNGLLVQSAADTAAWLKEGDNLLTKEEQAALLVAAKLTHEAMRKQADADVLTFAFAESM